MTTIETFRRILYFRQLVRKLYATLYMPVAFQRSIVQAISTPTGQFLYDNMPPDLEIEPLIEYCIYDPIAKRMAIRSTNLVEPHLDRIADSILRVGRTWIATQFESIRENGISWRATTGFIVAATIGSVGIFARGLIEYRRVLQASNPDALSFQDIPVFSATRVLLKNGHRAVLSWMTVGMVSYICAWMFTLFLQAQMEKVVAKEHPINEFISWYAWTQWYASILLILIDVTAYALYPLKKLYDLKSANLDVIDGTLKLIGDEVVPELQKQFGF